MKTLLTFVLATAAGLVVATPSANNYHAVTNDWYNGNFSNVYELSQMRLAANSNDVVGLHLVNDWNMRFSDYVTVSNSLSRLIAASDLVQEPAFTNVYNVVRPFLVSYCDEYLPSPAGQAALTNRQHAAQAQMPMLNDIFLKILWDKGLW